MTDHTLLVVDTVVLAILFVWTLVGVLPWRRP